MSENTEQLEENKQKVEIVEVDLSVEQLEEKKIHLLSCELNKEDSDMQLQEYISQLDMKLPARLLEDSIERMKKDIEEKKFRSANQQTGEEKLSDATEAELDLMRIKLVSMENTKKLDIPMRDLRLRIHMLRKQKESIDAPENQITKLEREIKTKKASVPKSRADKEQLSYVG